jgi:hypothetical protein
MHFTPTNVVLHLGSALQPNTLLVRRGERARKEAERLRTNHQFDGNAHQQTSATE